VRQRDESVTIAEAQRFIEALWQHYVAITPDALRIHDLLRARGETFSNDHIALRTFSDVVDAPGASAGSNGAVIRATIGVDRLAKPFIARGYVESGSYRFAEKRLRARSFRHPSGALPRVFISELELDACSDRLREIVGRLVTTIPPMTTESLLTAAPTWDPISYETYRVLLAESDYAAWVAVFGIRVNHFTVHFNDLRSFDELAELNAFLEQNGFRLNGESTKIQGGPDQLLEQSSTIAAPIPWCFAGGDQHDVPGGYYEFARRYLDPTTGTVFEGFVAASANKIFESTDVRGRR